MWPVATLGLPPKKRICLTSFARRFIQLFTSEIHFIHIFHTIFLHFTYILHKNIHYINSEYRMILNLIFFSFKNIKLTYFSINFRGLFFFINFFLAVFRKCLPTALLIFYSTYRIRLGVKLKKKISEIYFSLSYNMKNFIYFKL